MFDKLIESNSAGADFKPRRKFFMVSTVLVGILFATAVVVSLYASDIGIGNADFELAELLAPVAQTEPLEEPKPQQQAMQNQQNTSERTTRQVLMASTSDPTKVPDTVSTAVNPYRSIPPGRFDIGIGPDSDGHLPTGDVISTVPGSSSRNSAPENEEEEIAPKAPPAPSKVEPRKAALTSIGVANGKAIDLPKPPYPPAAIAINIQGAVNVQVTIDENGKVISAKAASGHPILRASAERAAWKARFTPTTLSKIPVKVTGVIIYNFTR